MKIVRLDEFCLHMAESTCCKIENVTGHTHITVAKAILFILISMGVLEKKISTEWIVLLGAIVLKLAFVFRAERRSKSNNGGSNFRKKSRFIFSVRMGYLFLIVLALILVMLRFNSNHFANLIYFIIGYVFFLLVDFPPRPNQDVETI